MRQFPLPESPDRPSRPIIVTVSPERPPKDQLTSTSTGPAHPPHHRTTPALNQHLAAPLRQIPGQTVRVADGDHRQFGFLLCLKDPPVPGALSGLHSADTGHSGPERQNRPQVKASLNRRIIASNSIECDSSPDIVTGLSWEVPKS